jgi:phosphate starvation-inducible PhoH-like protein
LTSTDVKPGNPVQVHFDDNALLTALFGHHDEHLLQIERLLDVTLRYRGNQLEIQGPETSREIANRAIKDLYKSLKKGEEVGPGEVQAAVRMASSTDLDGARISIRTRKRTITPRSPVQAKYLEALARADLTFGLGPAGTGKTYLAVAMAVSDLIQGKVDRLILSRPAVEAGERLGFLPGDLQDKSTPICARFTMRCMTCCPVSRSPVVSKVVRLKSHPSRLCAVARCRGPLSFLMKPRIPPRCR